MYVLFTDETNRDASEDRRFFIYGGLFLPIEKLPELNTEMARIRAAAGYKPIDVFKFDTNSRPKEGYVTPGKHTQAKQEVLALCKRLGARFIANLTHHEIIRTQPLGTQIEYAANRVIYRFHDFLCRKLAHGICVIDCFPCEGQWKFIREKFTQGMLFPQPSTPSNPFPPDRELRVERILLFSASTDNASHLASAADIVLGSFRYCINNPPNTTAAIAMMKDVVQIMWHRREGDTYHVGSYGWIQSPDTVRVARYQADYDELMTKINELLKEAADESAA